jgi:kinesin family protein 3/17
VRKAKFNLIDLAGSEKWGTGAYSVHQGGKDLSKELTAINGSLSALGNCISALADRNRKHVPFRDSPLTRLLQDSLGGNTRTLVLATVSPCAGCLEETASTLGFATRATAITARLRPNQV